MKSKTKYYLAVLALSLALACTTDPIIPADYVIDNPPVIPVQDPGIEDLCEEGIISFQHQVLPIMVSACAYSGCHDAATAEEGIVLDTYENIRKEVKPGDPNDSELYESITDDEDDIMPPPPAERLSSEQLAIIKKWIEQGAEETTCGTACDPTSSSYKVDIYPVLKNYCVGCHSVARADGNVKLDSYDDVVYYANNGTLLGTIRHDDYYVAMPPSGSKISNCKINQIEKWIAEGAKNN
jgi:mono/diheme cytochrome c family protein